MDEVAGWEVETESRCLLPGDAVCVGSMHQALQTRRTLETEIEHSGNGIEHMGRKSNTQGTESNTMA